MSDAAIIVVGLTLCAAIYGALIFAVTRPSSRGYTAEVIGLVPSPEYRAPCMHLDGGEPGHVCDRTISPAFHKPRPDEFDYGVADLREQHPDRFRHRGKP